MTVKELRKLLKRFNSDAEVTVFDWVRRASIEIHDASYDVARNEVELS